VQVLSAALIFKSVPQLDLMIVFVKSKFSEIQVQRVPSVSEVEGLRSGYVILTCLSDGLSDQLSSVLKTRGLQILSRKYWNDVSIYQI
jgi:hypothetical protein